MSHRSSRSIARCSPNAQVNWTPRRWWRLRVACGWCWTCEPDCHASRPTSNVAFKPIELRIIRTRDACLHQMPKQFPRTLGAALIALGAARAAAQCPDGTPPPCRGTVAVASARRVNPPLNPGAWIVVPFGNVTRSPELAWLRDASVNLLSMDLGRWTGIN